MLDVSARAFFSFQNMIDDCLVKCLEWNIRFISGTGKALRLKAQECTLHSHILCACVLWVGIGRYGYWGSDWRSDS